ncbi:hypothetical protein B0J11DRAFT_591548 [Dendryphion nanum]|uniref:Uncharacterized protein n=1 Tax=Dendryphion nanum TaxID=256645 RepID=A0A9P9IFQ3_9PLEO|nr:hypothetical protein B0J11DRAFT_591548 [Dendryphion nanum]
MSVTKPNNAVLRIRILWLLAFLTSTLALPIPFPLHGTYQPLSHKFTPPPHPTHRVFLSTSFPLDITISPPPDPRSLAVSPTHQPHFTPPLENWQHSSPQLKAQPESEPEPESKPQMLMGKPWMHLAGYLLLLYSFLSVLLLMLLWSQSWITAPLEPTERFLWGYHPLESRFGGGDGEREWYGAGQGIRIGMDDEERMGRHERLMGELRRLGMI